MSNISVISNFKPLRNNVFVEQLDGGIHITKGGIITPDDNMTVTGARPRWGKVFAVGPDVTDVVVGEWVLVAHGRWTNAMTLEVEGQKVKIWRIDWPDAALVACDEDPREQGFN